jgi:thiol-disulfide isomerase/thioredoxin
MTNRRQLLWAALLGVLLPGRAAHAQQPATFRVQPPEIEGIDEWINSKPLKLRELHGRVVVLHFWTFGCSNCKHNFPWYREWQKTFADKDVTIIGIHTPETDGEAKLDAVKKSVKDAGFTFPVAVDTNKTTWNVWGNRWWPSVYLIDRQGYARYRWDGELDWQGAGGQKIMQQKIEALLREK